LPSILPSLHPAAGTHTALFSVPCLSQAYWCLQSDAVLDLHLQAAVVNATRLRIQVIPA